MPAFLYLKMGLNFEVLKDFSPLLGNLEIIATQKKAL